MTPITPTTLRSEALAARAAGDADRAVAAWRRLLDSAPDSWRAALELKRDLLQGLHNPDSDPRFCRAARMLPDAEWIGHYAGAATLPASELEAIAFRAHEMRERHTADGRIEVLLGQVARQRRDWPEAARAFAAARALDPAHPDWARLAAEARQYARLAAQPAAAQGGSPDYEVLVINLDGNATRMAEMGRQCAGFPVQPQRLAAVAGDVLPTAAVAMLAGSPGTLRGTLGCFLSHAAAWERLLAGSASCALVLEDDALPLLPFPATIAGLGLPPGWDVVWVNDRMQPPLDPDTTAGFGTVGTPAAVHAFPAWHDAVGCDGYLVSRDGACKLLNWCRTDGFAHDVDWRVLAYALTPDAVAALPPGHTARRLLDAIVPLIPRTERLQAYVLHPALVREVSLRSDRQDIDRLCRAA